MSGSCSLGQALSGPLCPTERTAVPTEAQFHGPFAAQRERGREKGQAVGGGRQSHMCVAPGRHTDPIHNPHEMSSSISRNLESVPARWMFTSLEERKNRSGQKGRNLWPSILCKQICANF